MAKAKSTAKDTTEEIVVTQDTLKEMFEQAKKEAIEELKEQLKETKTEPKAGHADGYIPETDEQKAWAEERVEVMAPLDANESDDVPLTVNGETIVIKRGYRVKIPRKFALVLESAIDQQMASKRFQDELQKPENQVTYVD